MSNYQANIITKSPATPTGPAQNGSAPGMWRMDEAAYWVKQGVWPTQGIIPGDTYFRYVTMLLSTTSLGNANNSLFVDSSGAFNPVGRNGNTTQGSVTPYSANWSNYFDGTGDYLTLPDNAALEPGSSDLTWEMWINTSNSTQYATLYSRTTGSFATGMWSLMMNLASSTSGDLGLYVADFSGGSPLLQTTGVNVRDNLWHHIAVVRNGSAWVLYVDGVSRATATWAGTIADISGGPSIARDQFYTRTYLGYISNLRIVKGTAVYTTAFTPPTAPLTAITNTSLLTCQSNRFRDASTNNFTVTPTGDVRVTDFAPFSPGSPGITYNQSDITNWSGYFDNNGDYLSVPANAAMSFGTGNFTIEAWVYADTAFSTDPICESRSSGGSAGGYAFLVNSSGFLNVYQAGSFLGNSTIALTTGTWNHVALVRSGTGTNQTAYYVNGAAAGTITLSANLTDGATNETKIGGSTTAGENWGGYISNLRVVKGTAVYTGAFTPPTTNLTAISGTSLLTLQNAAFTDNSTNNFVITPNGNVTVTGNSPFNTVGYWSNYFDGTDDAVVAPNTPANFGSNNFTAECWVMFTTNSIGYQPIMGNHGSGDAQGWVMTTETNNRLYFYYSTNGSSWAGSIDTGITPSVGVWTHVAVVRNSNTFTFYVNGVASGTSTNSSALHSPTGNFRAGRYPYYPGGTRTLTGWISNVRLVNGTAVYTSNFTPSTTPLTAITNTSLLTCQSSRFVDTSANAYSITLEGNPRVQSFDPFYTATIASNGGSMYFDGSGDYLTSPSSPNYNLGTGDFIVEVWVNPSVQGGHGSSNNDCIIDFRPGSNGAYGTLYSFNSGASINWVVSGAIRITGGAIPNNAWSHLMVSRVSGSTRLFINGVQSGSTYADSTNYLEAPVWLGQFNDGPGAGWFQGYMSGARIVKGTGVSSTFTPPTAPQTPTAATTLLLNGMNAGLFDATAINDMETVSGAQVVTNISKFGGSSAFFNGTGGFLDIPAASSKESAFGTGDFTVEMWLYFNSVSGSPTIITFNNFGSGDGFFLNVESSAIGVRADGSTPIRASTTVTTGVWYHVAVTRSSGTLRLFQDGVNVGSTTWTTNCTAGLLRIGQPKDTTGSTYALSGYMDELRVTKGYARYTSNFTPPTSAFLPY